MNGRICLITGATNGIGKATATELARRGATVLLTTRSPELGEATKQEIMSRTGNERIDVFHCELGSFVSIMKCCEDVKRRYDKLHVLINNAGILETKRRLSRDGVEMTFAVNHLAPFLMTNLLLDPLKRGAEPHTAARIITVSSAAHTGATMKFDDLEGKQKFSGGFAYCQSKLANILFTKKLARILAGTGVTANCLHPGAVNTKLFDKFPSVIAAALKLFLISPERGAQTSVYLATSPDVETISGEYFKNKTLRRSSKTSYDVRAADKLWDISRHYVGI
jgi:NAD(P)-dependent dehydrogenase (short-subunit alcohol dehydrogenase family)